MSGLLWIAIAGCAVSVATDLSTRRIPNALTFGLAICAVVMQAAGGLHSLASSIAALVLVMAFGLFAFTRGWLGGGDVKLAAAVAAAIGLANVPAFVVYTAAGGGVLAVVSIAMRGQFFATIGLLLRYGFRFSGLKERLSAAAPLPYAFAIFFGVVMVALAKTALPWLQLA